MNRLTYIVLVNWNGWADTIECLESVFRLDDRGFTVVIVDNGSTDDSMARILSWADGNLNILPPSDRTIASFVHPPCDKPISAVVYDTDQATAGGGETSSDTLVIVRNSKNVGFAGANNIGLRYALARGDAARVWLLNNDTVVHPGALTAIVKRMDEKPKGGMCGSTLLFYGRPDRVQAYGGGRYLTFLGLSWHIGFREKLRRPPKPERAERIMNYVVGASLCVSREFLAEIGLMSEDYFLFFEEVDWAMRARGSYTLAYAPDSVVYHKVGQSIGTHMHPRHKSFQCDYYTLRNRLIFTSRYRPSALPGVYLVLVVELLLRILVGRWDLARMVLMLLLRGPAEGRAPASTV